MRMFRKAMCALAAMAVLCSSVTARAEDSETLKRIKQDGKIRLGMYLGFEGLSFTQRGKKQGLEVSVAELLTPVLTKQLGREIKVEIVNQEWSQIIQELRAGKYDAAFSAVIPSTLYAPSKISYTQSYLDTGPVICCQKTDGKPAKAVTEDVASLEGKRVVVINDPAVRRVLRNAGVYVPADEGKKDLEKAFPKAETEAAVKTTGAKLVAVKEIVQLDEMPDIYKMLSEGTVDAGVIDLGIVWWVSTDSERWSKKIHAFTKPVGPYIYCGVTREEDKDVQEVLDKAIGEVKKTPEYAEVLKKWHGAQFDWKLKAADFLK